MIIPRPASSTALPGELVLGPALNLTAGPGAERPARLLADYLGPDRTRTDSAGTVRDPRIVLRLDPAAHDHPHGYDLLVEPHQATLAAPTEAGLFNGVQTLRQLLPPAALAGAAAPAGARRWPACHVRDAPRLAWRGVMLDVARHFMPLDFVLRFVDEIALHKFNVLHLHLTDDQGWRMEIPGLPLLTGIGARRTESMVGSAVASTGFDGVPHAGHYTRRELEALVEYAAARGVTVVPEIGMPSHTRAAIAAYPAIGNRPDVRLPVWTSWGVSEDILGVHEGALDFCRQVLTEVMDVFPSHLIHIGGDECVTTQWSDSPAAHERVARLGLSDTSQLVGWFLGEMHRFLAENGRRAACWNDSVGVGELPRDMVTTAWLKPEHATMAIARGHQVIMAPHEVTYLDYRQSEHPGEPQSPDNRVLTLAAAYAFDPLSPSPSEAEGGGEGEGDRDGEGFRAVAEDSHVPGILGTQAQIWTECAPTPEVVRHLMYPRLCALAEGAWSDGRRDLPEFTVRLRHHLRRLAALGALPATRPTDGDRPGGPGPLGLAGTATTTTRTGS